MAVKRRTKHTGQGMDALFDLGALAPRPDDDLATAANTPIKAKSVSASAPKAVDYWVRGVFRFGGGKESTHTIRAVGMSQHLDADVAKFTTYLSAEGWQFPEGRATLVEVLGVGADDGMQIALSRGEH